MARKWHGNLICLIFAVCTIATIFACSEGEPQAICEIVRYTQKEYILPDGSMGFDDEVSVTYTVTNVGDVEIEEFGMVIEVYVYGNGNVPFFKAVSGGPIKPGRHVTQTIVIPITSHPILWASVESLWVDGERMEFD